MHAGWLEFLGSLPHIYFTVNCI
uniref:Uncharacterized protein n=1 Tax=Anguilla anguilla TaxID=7936 RepID=A0A0E9QCU9_ANGAN